MLLENYRSHPALLTLPSKLFYNNMLVPCADIEEVSSCLSFSGLTESAKGKIPLVFHGVMGTEMREERSHSYFNPYELEVVILYVGKLLDEGIKPEGLPSSHPTISKSRRSRKLSSCTTWVMCQLALWRLFRARRGKWSSYPLLGAQTIIFYLMGNTCLVSSNLKKDLMSA